MKLRIKSNTVRIRLTKSEVKDLGEKGYLEDKTDFISNRFCYKIKADNSVDEMKIDFTYNRIELLIPEKWAKDWDRSEKIGFDGIMKIDEEKFIYILIEKDFKCLDETTEDQSDNFENPSTACAE